MTAVVAYSAISWAGSNRAHGNRSDNVLSPEGTMAIRFEDNIPAINDPSHSKLIKHLADRFLTRS